MDKTDPICGMPGTIPAHGHWFCNPGCITKYEKMHNITDSVACTVPALPWYKEKLFLITAGLISIPILHLILTLFGIYILHPLVNELYNYLRMIVGAVIIGLLLGGIIDFYIPREYISKYLARRGKRTIFYSVGLGFLTAACSHGILAISIELYKKGASASSVVSFLLASPWANLPVTILLFGLFGWKAVFYVGLAIVIALNTGLIFQVLESRGLVERNSNTVAVDETFSIRQDIKRRWQESKGNHFTGTSISHSLSGILTGSWSLAKMVLGWIFIGMFLAAAISAYVPHSFISKYMGPSIWGLLATLVAATIIEICSEGTAPLAFEIYKQTAAFGNAFVFLMAGVATDYTELGLLWSNVGKRTAIWLPIITVPQIVVFGYLLNILLR